MNAERFLKKVIGLLTSEERHSIQALKHCYDLKSE